MCQCASFACLLAHLLGQCQQGLLAVPEGIDRQRAVLDVALAVKADLAGDAGILDLAKRRQIFLGVDRIGLLHGFCDDHHGVVGIRRVLDDVGIVFFLVSSLESIQRRRVFNPARDRAINLVVDQALAGQARQGAGADGIAAHEVGGDAKLPHLAQHGAGAGVDAAEENQVRLLGLDRGQDGAEIGRPVAGVLGRHHFDAVGLGVFQEFRGQPLAIGSAVVNHRDLFCMQGFCRIAAHRGAKLGIVGHHAEGGVESLFGIFGAGGGRRDLRDAGVEINLRCRNRGARLQMPDYPRHFGVDQFLGDAGGLFRIAGVVFSLQYELDLLAADDQVPGVQIVDRHACAVFIVLADMRHRTGNRADVRNLHDLLLGLRGSAEGQGDGGGQQGCFGMILHVFSPGFEFG
ncbi:hypothetical protein CFU_0139 [Collimonas fungivorans Ter331]|uniref:Uncharacterized protein n=1 Tax=Collimonas fungivorans (strain Ter331) TaxID=1005048 RepID=G0AG86_COLFT|nr:hypothetical protein CFU_0139 [Collimonas fungivorans Ter331]